MAKISTRKRGKKWYYSVEATEYTLDGKRKRIERGGYATQREAETEGTKALAALARGNIAFLAEKCAVEDFLDEWLAVKKKEIRPTTARSYSTSVNILKKHMGSRDLRKLRPRDVNALVLELAAEGYARGTISNLLKNLREALAYAVFPLEVLSANPAQYIKVPKSAPAKVTERHIIREGIMSVILSAYPFGHKYHIPILIAYHTGMRIGEIFGLTWDSVDLVAGTVTIERQLLRLTGGECFGPVKTSTSLRTIPIDGELIAALKKWKARQAADEMRTGPSYLYAYEAKDGKLWQLPKGMEPTEGMTRRPMICTTMKGQVFSRLSLMAALRNHGLNSHSFRHTHATICAENGAPPKGIAGRLGHSSTAITENLYTHETEKMQMETIAAFISKKS